MDDYLSRQLATMSLSNSSGEPKRDYSRRQIYTYGVGDARPLPVSPEDMDVSLNKTDFGPVGLNARDQKLPRFREDQRISTGRDSRATTWRPYKHNDFVAKTQIPPDHSASSSQTNPFSYEIPSACAAPAGTGPRAMTPPSVKHNSGIPSAEGYSNKIFQVSDSVWSDQTQKMISSSAGSNAAALQFSSNVNSTAQQAAREPYVNTPTPQNPFQTLLESHNPLYYRKTAPSKDQKSDPQRPSRLESGAFLVPEVGTYGIIKDSKPNLGCQTSQVREAHGAHGHQLPSTRKADIMEDRGPWEDEHARMTQADFTPDIRHTTIRRGQHDAHQLDHKRAPPPIPVVDVPTSRYSAHSRNMDTSVADFFPALPKKSGTRRAKSPYPTLGRHMNEQPQQVRYEDLNDAIVELERHNRKVISAEHSMTTTPDALMTRREPPKEDDPKTALATDVVEEEPHDFEDVGIDKQNEAELDDWTDIKEEDVDAWKVLKKKDWDGPVQLFP